MEKELEIIQKYINIIEDKNWETLYRILNVNYSGTMVGSITQHLLDAGINPLEQDFTYPYLFSNMFKECIVEYPLEIPLSVTRIGSLAFTYSNIPKIIFPPSLKRIKSNAFKGSSLLHLDLTHCKMEYIGGEAFSTTSLTDVQLQGNNDLTIDIYAFYNCADLKEIILPKECGLSRYAISCCSSLHTIRYDGTIANFHDNVYLESDAIYDVKTDCIECKDGKIGL